MFARLASVFIALVAVTGVLAVPAAPTNCPLGQKTYCCSLIAPGGVVAYPCPAYDPASGYPCGGQVRCCVYQDNNPVGYGCSAA